LAPVRSTPAARHRFETALDREGFMLKSVMHDIRLAVQAKNGLTPAVLSCMAFVALAALGAFAFLCVAGYDWLALQLGILDAALIMTGVLVAIAVFGAIVCALMRRRARERAIVERAARARASAWLLDPKNLATTMQIGHSMGFERIMPIALLGILAAQWARDRREPRRDGAE
jgi:hypothetical protein